MAPTESRTPESTLPLDPGPLSPPPPLLQVRAVHRPPLAPLSLELAAGECLVVRGPSGAGKTLLLRAVADLDPHEGELILAGQACESMPAPQWRTQVGYLPAEPAWWTDRLAPHFSDWPAQAPLVRQLLLPENLGEAPVSRLSTGERQRLALLRALEMRPRVLLLDEPTSALDAQATQAVEDLLRARQDQGLAMIWVTHDEAQAQRVGQRQLTLSPAAGKEGAP